MCKEWPARHCLLEVGHSYVGVPTRTANCLQKGLLLSIWRRKVAGACNPCVDLLVFTQYHTSCQAHRSEGEVELYMTRGGCVACSWRRQQKTLRERQDPAQQQEKKLPPQLCQCLIHSHEGERFSSTSCPLPMWKGVCFLHNAGHDTFTHTLYLR